MRNQAQVLLSVFQDPRLRRFAGAFGAFATAGEAMWLAVVVYAYQRGGAVEAGLVGFGLLLLPALLLVSLPRLAAIDQSAEAPPARHLSESAAVGSGCFTACSSHPLVDVCGAPGDSS